MTATAMASNAPRGRARRILHFDRRPGPSEKRALEAMGVRLLAYIPGNAVVATVPPGFVPPEEVNVDWVGAIEPRWKLARALHAAAHGQPGEVHGVVVEFFADARPDQARAVLAANNVQVLRNDHLPAHAFAVRADIGRIEALAGDDSVASIVPASPAILQNQPTHWCAGPSTIFGPVASFVVINDGWDGPGQGSALDLTYHFNNFTADLPGSSVITEIVRAMDAWAAHAAVGFTQAAGPDQSRSIDILFGIGDHGDPFPFDGFGGTLAHTFLPTPDNVEPIAGDIHFDDAEFWQIGADIDLFTVALHELGHALGLGHSDDPTAVMYAFYGGPLSGLAPDDIAGIQSIYAAASAPGGDCLTLSNDGCSPLVIRSIAAPTWAVLVPAPPFTIPPGGSQQVCIDACGACAGSDLVDTLIVTSDDPVTPIVNVPLTVDCNDPPIADAGPDQTITDSDGDGSETVMLSGAASIDTDGTIVNYTWSEDAVVLVDTAAPTTSIVLPVGIHSITLRVTDNDGTTATDTVVITIEGTCTSAATRILPGAYSPGLPTPVQITVTPEVGALNWAVEETPPAGWTVSAISDFGTFVGGTVKWGPFTGSTPVTLSYDVTPPALESTSGCFAGVISVDGATRSVCGDDCVSACPCHPADSNCDYSITIDEATAYGACWLSGCAWPVEPSPPNIDFVTRAGFLWQSGELYCCDVSQPPPTLWVSAVPSCPTNSAVMGAAAVTSLGSAEREFHLVRDGNDLTLLVQIVVTPDVNASTFAIEETVSGNATIGAISAGGRFDVTTGRFRWGPFSDGRPRVLSYEIRGEQLDAVMSSVAGRLSVDGVSLPITDRGLVVPNPGDFDADDDLDLSDFLGFIECFERGLESVPLVCRLFDFDADGDVDLTDLLAFQATFTGAR